MADQVIGVLQATSPDRKLDTTELTVGVNTVQRERHQNAGGAANELQDVRGAAPSAADFGAVVRPLVASVPVHANATLTASGSSIISTKNFPDQQLVLMINVVNAPTGTAPTIVFSVQEIDPGNATTPTSGFRESQVISAAGVYQVPLFSTTSNQVKVAWVVTGSASPTFTGVYATLVSKSSPATSSVQGELRVVQQGTQLFNDAWDTGAMDTTDRWTIASGGGGVAAADAGNVMTLGSGTTANGWSTLESKPTFRPASPGWNRVTWAIHIESAVGTNAYRFWGIGTNPGTPTAALPLTDAVGFEVDINGKCNVVTFASGARNLIQDLSSATGNNKQVTDAASHQYIIDVRGDRIFWFIDSLDNCVAEIPTGALGPDVNVLPLKAMSVANSSAPGASRVVTCDSVYLGDMTKSTSALSDGVFGFRRATVKAASVAAVATDTSLVVAISPNNVPVIDIRNLGGPGTSGNLISSPGTSSAGVAGPLMLGKVTTAAPAMTTGQVDAMSLTTGGALRADVTTIAGVAPVVKAGSTAAVAGDPALVVSVSPNTTVNVTPVSSTTSNSPAQQAVGTSSVSILASNAARKKFRITNTGSTIIYLGFGQTPTTTAYHVALAACSNAANDGTGGVSIDDTWDGAVNAISSIAGGTVCVMELT